MKEKGDIITLDKSCYREIKTPEQTIKPVVNPFRKIDEERITKIRLQSTRQQLADIPMLALILPIYEIPEKSPDFTPGNKFLDFMDAIVAIFGLLFPNDKEEKKQK